MTRVPSGVQLLRQDDFTGGLNLRANPFRLGANESPDVLNVDMDPRGGVRSRQGSSPAVSLPIGNESPLVRLESYRTGLFSQLFIHTTSELFVLSDLGDFCSQEITSTGTNPFGFATAQYDSRDATSNVYTAQLFVSTLDDTNGWVWDGSTVSTLTHSGPAEWQDDLSTPDGEHVPAARFLASHVDRLWAAYTVEDGEVLFNRLRFSHPLFPRSWREMDYIDVPDGGQVITGIKSYGGNLVVFKEHAVFILTGYSTDTFQLVPLTLRHGCGNPLAYTELEGVLYFFDGTLGLMAFDGSRMSSVMDRVKPAFFRSDGSSIDPSSVRVWSGDGKVFVSNNIDHVTFVFDPSVGRSGAWSRYQVWMPAQSPSGRVLVHGCDWTTESDGNVAVFFHDGADTVQYFDWAYDGVDSWDDTSYAYPSQFVTGWQDAGNVSVKKRWRRCDMVCSQPVDYQGDYEIDVKVLTDWQEGVVRRTGATAVREAGTANPFVWGVSNWDEANWGGIVAGSQYTRSIPLGPARAVQLRLTGPSGRSWGVQSLTYKFNYRRLKA